MQIAAQIKLEIAASPNFREACQTTVQLLRSKFPRYNWVGIYMVDDETLVLEAWDGLKAAEHVRIPIGKGICGAAAQIGKTVAVPDVREDSRYLQCFAETRAEIVVPMLKEGRVIGEIDIDSDQIGAFGQWDRLFLEDLAGLLTKLWEKEKT